MNQWEEWEWEWENHREAGRRANSNDLGSGFHLIFFFLVFSVTWPPPFLSARVCVHSVSIYFVCKLWGYRLARLTCTCHNFQIQPNPYHIVTKTKKTLCVWSFFLSSTEVMIGLDSIAINRIDCGEFLIRMSGCFVILRFWFFTMPVWIRWKKEELSLKASQT